MAPVWLVLYYIAFIFFVLLCLRVILQLIQQFSPHWRPTGVVAVLFEAVFTATDPPLKTLGRLVPPLRLGNVMLDLAFLIVMLVTVMLMNLFSSLHAAAAPAVVGMPAF